MAPIAPKRAEAVSNIVIAVESSCLNMCRGLQSVRGFSEQAKCGRWWWYERKRKKGGATLIYARGHDTTMDRNSRACGYVSVSGWRDIASLAFDRSFPKSGAPLFLVYRICDWAEAEFSVSS